MAYRAGTQAIEAVRVDERRYGSEQGGPLTHGTNRRAAKADENTNSMGLSAPRVNVAAGGHIEPVIGEETSLEEFRARFFAAFGTTEKLIAEARFQDVLNI